MARQSKKHLIRWNARTGLGVTVLILIGVLMAGIYSGDIKNLHGAHLVDVEPQAGGSDPQALCGTYDHWVGHKVDKVKVKQIGKVFRILSPGSMVTMDHNPERINILINDHDIVLEVRCG